MWTSAPMCAGSMPISAIKPELAAILFIEHGALVMFWQCQQGLVAPASNWPLKLD
jgi:hypothetical protein